MDIHKKENSNNWNNIGSYQTLNITNCMESRNHAVGCQCILCKSCREDIIEYYKNKKKKKIKKKKIISKSYDSYEKSLPIIINKKKKKKIDYMTFNSLPNMYDSKFFEVKNVKVEQINCLLCNKKNNNKLVNDFYFLCEKCYITNELL